MDLEALETVAIQVEVLGTRQRHTRLRRREAEALWRRRGGGLVVAGRIGFREELREVRATRVLQQEVGDVLRSRGDAIQFL